MMIQMMDRNRNGKLDKREMGMMDLDELLKNPEAAKVRAYVPDLDELVKKVRASITQLKGRIRTDCMFNIYYYIFVV